MVIVMPSAVRAGGVAVPSYDFEVDLESLVAAAQGMVDTVQLFKDKDVEDLVPSEGDLGSDVVWGAVEEFKNRWELGMNNLKDDMEEAGGRLAKIASNYARFDQEGHDKLKGAASDVSGFRLMGS
jgi:hypothetical protein